MTAISADWVLPVDGPPLRDAFVAWDDGGIVDVAPGRAERHFEGAVILPGIVNAHSHLEYAVYAGFGDGSPFGDWLGLHIRRKRALAHERWSRSPGAAPRTRLQPASRTTADYSFSGASAAAAGARPARDRLPRGLRLRPRRRDGNSRRRASAQSRATSYGSGSRLTRPTPARWTSTAGACRSGIPVGTHLVESAAENEWMTSGTGPLAPGRELLVEPSGKRSVATLDEVLGPDLLCAHCVHLDDAEIGLLAERDVPVAHCPRSNALLGCGTAPIAALRRAGARGASARTLRRRRRHSTRGRSCARPST